MKMVREHHERLDGSGYPKKLKGEEISLYGRMIAIIDSYDAMTSERPYKKVYIPLMHLKRLFLNRQMVTMKSLLRNLFSAWVFTLLVL